MRDRDYHFDFGFDFEGFEGFECFAEMWVLRSGVQAVDGWNAGAGADAEEYLRVFPVLRLGSW